MVFFDPSLIDDGIEIEVSYRDKGVRLLPWLILTDKKHIVQAEGFGSNELYDKITALREE